MINKLFFSFIIFLFLTAHSALSFAQFVRDDMPAPTSPPTIDGALSAYLGLIDIMSVDNLRPFRLGQLTGCRQFRGDDAMPVVFNSQLPAGTILPSAFRVVTQNGDVFEPGCATLDPANDPDENRTVLLTGQMGTIDNLPVTVIVTEDLITVNGESLRGSSVTVTIRDVGPLLLLAEPQTSSDECTARGSTDQVLLTFQGGITGPNGVEVGEEELVGFTLVNSNSDRVQPTAFDDLNDNDNHLVLCVPSGFEPATVEVDAATVYDPTDIPNRASSAPVI